MKKILTVALLLLCPVASWAPLALLPHPAVAAAAKSDKKVDAPYVKLPTTLTVKPNRYFTIKPDTNCASLKWIVPYGLDSLDPNIPVKDANLKILIGDAGVYVVQCYGALADQASDIASCTITIGTPPPPPPPPPPPGPPSPLTQAFQAGYNLDTDADKTTSLKLLQALYAAMAKDAPNWSNVTTNAQAAAEIASIVQAPSGLPDKTKVQNLRKAIGAEMAKTFGTTVAPITLTAVATELSAIAVGLQGIKP